MTAHELLVRAAMCRWAACSSKSESLASFVSEQARALVAGTLVNPDELLRLALFAEILTCEGDDVTTLFLALAYLGFTLTVIAAFIVALAVLVRP